MGQASFPLQTVRLPKYGANQASVDEWQEGEDLSESEPSWTEQEVSPRWLGGFLEYTLQGNETNTKFRGEIA